MTAPLKLCVRRSERRAPAGSAVEVTLRVPSEVACIEETVELVARHCFTGHRATTRQRFRLRVALSEALANAIICGNGEDPRKRVLVRAECLPDRILLHVTDEGPGFDPTTRCDKGLPDDLDHPCGRGLFLIENLMDHVRFNVPGNSICMTLRRH